MSDQQAVTQPSRSVDIGELAKALAAAQGEYGAAIRDSVNPHFKSSYADLASVTNACRPALTKHGIAVVQRLSSKQASVTVSTMLVHSSGQWISDELTVPVSKADAQGFVAACTYARRASLSAMTGIAPEDDDGNEASGHSPQQTLDTASKQAAQRKAEARKPQPAPSAQREPGDDVPDDNVRVPDSVGFRTGIVWVFGRNKGRDLAEFSDKDLSSAFDFCLGAVADPEKAKWKNKNQELADQVMAEIERREKGKK